MYLRPYLIIQLALHRRAQRPPLCLVDIETIMSTDLIFVSASELSEFSRAPVKQLGISIENSIWALHHFPDTLNQGLN